MSMRVILTKPMGLSKSELGNRSMVVVLKNMFNPINFTDQYYCWGPITDMGANERSQKKIWILFVVCGQKCYNNEFEMSIEEFRAQKSPSFSITYTKNIIM